MSLRWMDYVAAHDEKVLELWQAAAETASQILFVVGEGFDPRALIGLERMCQSDLAPKLNVLLLELSHGGSAPGLREMAAQNAESVLRLVETSGASLTSIKPPEVADIRSLGKATSIEIQRLTDSNSMVVVDISALPSRIYFPVLAGLIQASDEGSCRELIATVCENPEVDRAILERGQEMDPGPIGGFAHGLTSLTVQAIKIWAPVLGENQSFQVRALLQYERWDEICPVLPFPSSRSRRTDDLILEHEYLFREPTKVETRNIIYADEENPFDLYRALCALSDRYASALAPLGQSQLVLSVHASKTLGLGTLLAAHERSLPVVAAGGGEGYEIDSAVDLESAVAKTRLSAFWLCGDPYR